MIRSMSKTSTILALMAALAAIKAAPAAYAAGQVALDHILGTYMVMAVQMDALRMGCF